MVGNDLWPAARAKNFLRKMNRSGYCVEKPTRYYENMKALADHIDIEVNMLMSMSPIEYGRRAFRSEDFGPFMKEILGIIHFVRMLVSYELATEDPTDDEIIAAWRLYSLRLQ